MLGTTKDNYTITNGSYFMYGYNQPQYGYQNPYMNNQYTTYQQPVAQVQQAQQTQQDVLLGKYVDSIDVVKASNVDMTGNIVWYPKSDKTEVFCKGLNPNTGASYILTYKLVQNEPTGSIEQLLSSLQAEVAELKNIVLESVTAPSKGGDKS